MSDYWSGKHVCVLGGSGFLGQPLCRALIERGAWLDSPPRQELDLLSDWRTGNYILYKQPVDVLFHLAADVGGIADNISRPAELFYNNVVINANVVRAAAMSRTRKVIALGSSCAYPSDAPLPLVESDYLKGEPEPTNAPYAYSKRLLLSHLQAAHTQYGLNYTYLILANLYGEGCETDPQKSHVIGALVRKFYEAKRDALPSVTLWGTGEAVRDFLHIDDAVEALLRAGEYEAHDSNYHKGERVFNIGTGYGASINTIAQLIAFNTGYEGAIKWDTSKPDGQAERVLAPLGANMFLGSQSDLALSCGISRTVAWYASTQKELAPA